MRQGDAVVRARTGMLLVALAAAVLVGVVVPSLSAAPREDGSFSCRAAAVRSGGDETSVANPGNDPCADDTAGSDEGADGLRLRGQFAETSQTPDDLDASEPADGDGASAEAGAAELIVGPLRVRGMRAEALATCRSQELRITGSSSVVGVRIGDGPTAVNVRVPSDGGRISVPVPGLGTLHLNTQEREGGTLTQRAVWLDAASGDDLVIGEASVGVQGTPCAEIPDTDGDGVLDPDDNCPAEPNAGQENNDGDAEGDACDADDDNDTVADGDDNCALVANTGQENNDGDGEGDACDADDDNDGSPDAEDCAPFDGAIHPGVADEPELGFVDSNCDGVDGNAAGAVFVATTGNDANPGTRELPRRTVNAGIQLATFAGDQKDVYVAAGEYDEGAGMAVATNVDVYGGYSAADWSRAQANVTRVEGRPQGVLADGDTGVTLQLLTVRGENGNGDRSAYGVRAINFSNLTLEAVDVSAGDGAPGAPGGNGANGGAGANGQPGADGDNDNNGPGAAGGAGGSGPGFAGGAGGRGGSDSGSGGGQTGAKGAGPAGGNGGGGGAGGDCTGNDGGNGATGGGGATGGAGAGGTNNFNASGATFVGQSGSNGSAGADGSGGGGGGGGAADDGTFCDDGQGNGGGGGGAGGDRGGGGGAGQSGGGSFAVYLFDSEMTVVGGSSLQAGNGGAGGAGGAAGTGGNGGAGAPGGDKDLGDVGRGGRGGNGGRGGDGGHGGGGPGGPSIGIFGRGATSYEVGDGSTIDFGSGGPGGASPGNDGQAGVAVLFL